MPQQQTLYPGFTAERFLLYMASLRRMPRARALERIDWALGAVGLSDVRGKTIRSLSGGMKQRLLLAQAILDEPDILILDEPTAGLDPRQRIAVRNLIAEIALQKIVIVSTHVVPDVEYVASELLLLSEGRLLRKASPAELTHELAGQVWEAELAESELPAAQAAGRSAASPASTQGISACACWRKSSRPLPAGRLRRSWRMCICTTSARRTGYEL